MCSYIARQGEIETPVSMLLIKLEPMTKEIRLPSVLDSTLSIQFTSSMDEVSDFLASSESERAAKTIGWITKAFKLVVEHNVYEVTALEQLHQVAGYAKQNEYAHIYPTAKPAFTPNRKWSATLIIDHRVTEAIGILQVAERSGQLRSSHEVFRTRPDELMFRMWLVRPKWVSNTSVEVIPKSWASGYKPFRLDVTT